MKNLYALLIGIFFSIIIVKGEIISWFRIQEMFLFQDIHMYGVIGSAIAVGAISILLIKKFNIKDITGKPIEIKLKPKRYTANFVGGSIFGWLGAYGCLSRTPICTCWIWAHHHAGCHFVCSFRCLHLWINSHQNSPLSD